MKKNLFGLLIILSVIVVGCAKEQEVPLEIPTGKFSGSFTRLHLDTKTLKIDTLKADLVITFSATTGYAVLSDTTTVHAGSKGGYIVDPLYIQFGDNTIPPGPIPTTGKTRLAGIYQYYYKDNVFKLAKSNDTLDFYYDLIRVP
ncbi:MAG: hypothetical protein EOP47_02390 [Sphingobacteriaceae bacterium]|nr:MAG: hypothetical protein EOP47_02390 [Sphingobacteriaceae bacterium]